MSHREIINKWPKIADLARDLEFPSEQFVTVYSWHRRGKIPHTYWPAIVKAARKRKIKGVTTAALFATEPSSNERAA